ncbi:hypothetical protein CK203_116186 [Vitis vinifera]|uniref:Uncharacterized protein n=1 Tax=Vitis vinifera TaxID=29760 RepID=A0A438FI36_VITVI|nr:hypothetical protein CK203_116186 [Vitis vinifera]
MSDEIAPITLTTLHEMMVDLTRSVEKIELILLEYPSSLRGAPGVAMPSLPHLTSPISVTLGASHPRPRPHSCSSNIPHPFHCLHRHDLHPSFGPFDHYSSLEGTSPSSTMSETLFRFKHTPE